MPPHTHTHTHTHTYTHTHLTHTHTHTLTRAHTDWDFGSVDRKSFDSDIYLNRPIFNKSSNSYDRIGLLSLS